MAPGKSTRHFLFFLVLLVFVSCNGLSTKNHPPLVFGFNLSSSPVSLGLVKNERPLVQFLGLSAMENSHLTVAPVAEGVELLQGKGDETPSVEWTDPAGTPYGLRLEDGHIYAIVVSPQGKAALYSLPEVYSSDPKICLVDVLPGALAQIQVAPDWGKNVKVYDQDVVPGIPSEFFSFEPKILGLYWQSRDLVSQGGFIEAKGADGKALRQPFLSGHFYLFLAGDGSVRDLTPPLN